MTPAPKRPDSLSKEIDDALEGIHLQDLDDQGRQPGGRKQQGAQRLWRGTIIGQSGDDLIVELGPTMQGVIAATEFDTPPAIGERFDFSLHGQEEGLWLLSRKEARAVAAWDELSVGALVQARVTGQNTGGLELKVGPLSAFMPASHVALGREEDLARYLGQTLQCEVLEVEPERKRVLLSRRNVLESERAESRKQSLGAISSGQVLTGKVMRLEPFGAFVDIGGGLEGLLHVSNIARSRVSHPSERLTVGQQVQVQVLEIKEGGKRIGLGMKQLEADPWDGAAGRYPTGTIVSGKVVRLMDFGAFIELEPGLEGLLHVSQIAKDRVRRIQDVVTVGQELSVRIVGVDTGARRIALSRLDERGAVIGSEDAVEGAEIEEVLQRSPHVGAKTNLGSLFKKLSSPAGRENDPKKPSKS